MRALRFALIAASLVASTAFASPSDPKNGVEYVTLAQPQPTQAAGKKVEVIEFFMYHCPHCNRLEPSFEQWVKKQGDNILLKRIPLPAQGANDPEAHLYLTLEALGRLGDMHQKVFNAVHVQHVRLFDDSTLAFKPALATPTAAELFYPSERRPLLKLQHFARGNRRPVFDSLVTQEGQRGEHLGHSAIESVVLHDSLSTNLTTRAVMTVDEVVTSAKLSELFGTPIEVLRTSDGRLVVVGQPEAPHHHGHRHED